MLRIRPDPVTFARVQRTMTETGKQARFAFARTLNDVALAIQAETYASAQAHLTIRTEASARFIRTRIRIPRGGFATRDEPRVQLEISDGDVTKNRGKSSLLATLSGGGGEKAQGRWGPLAFPTRNLRTTAGTVIPRSMYPRALRLLERRDVDGGALAPTLGAKRTRRTRKKGATLGAVRTRAGKWLIRGKERTFAIDPRYQKAGKPTSYGVYQRTGPGRGDVRLLWRYRDSYKVPSRVPFQSIADTVTVRDFGARFDRNLAHALATAR